MLYYEYANYNYMLQVRSAIGYMGNMRKNNGLIYRFANNNFSVNVALNTTDYLMYVNDYNKVHNKIAFIVIKFKNVYRI